MRAHAGRHWTWRCHIDLSEPNRSVLEFLLPSICAHDAAIFHRRQYVPATDALPTPWIWPPAIDPLAPKNMALSAEDAAYIVDQFGIDVSRPLVTQVSRFDPWKDPLGVIEAWRIVRALAPRRAARPRRLDGARRPGGLGVLQPHGGGGRRRPRHLHPLEPEQRRLRRGERVPGALRRPSCRSRSARASGSPSPRPSGRGGRWWPAGSAGSSTRSRTARPATSSTRSRSAPSDEARPGRP